MKAAIYHFTDGSYKRPSIHQKELDALTEYAKQLGYKDIDVYCDRSLFKYEHEEFERLLSNSSQYDAIITKDYRHICKNTLTCINTVKDLLEKGVKVFTLDNANWEFSNNWNCNRSYKIAIYCSRYENSRAIKEDIPMLVDILKLYVKKKTNWEIIDQYVDKSTARVNASQIELDNLILNKDKYDLVLVHSLNDISWKTSRFCSVMKQLQLDVLSLQEGYLRKVIPNDICRKY